MTTATQTPETTTSPVTSTPASIDFGSMLYGEPTPTIDSKPSQVPPTTSDTSLSATPPASPVAPETVTATLPTGTDAEHAKIATPDVKPDPDAKQQASARRLGQELADKKRELAQLAESHRVLQAKLDGTYEDPPQPTREQIEARAEFRGRETASRTMANGLYGEALVHAQVYDDDSPYKQLVLEKPWLHARVAQHPHPAVEAMRVLKEQEFFATYGEDVTHWVSKIEAEVTSRIQEKLKTQTITPVTGTPVPTVTGARGSGGRATDKSVEELFYGGTKP